MNNKGFTLVEVVTASAVALIIGTFLMSILVSNTGVFYKQNAIVSEGLSLNDTVSKISQMIKQSTGVAAIYPEISPTYTTGDNTLVLKLPAIGTNDVISNVYDYVVITKDSSKTNILWMKVFPDSQSTRQKKDLVLTTILDSVAFSFLDKNGGIVSPPQATGVSMSLSLLSKTGSVSSNRSSTTITNLRNI